MPLKFTTTIEETENGYVVTHDSWETDDSTGAIKQDSAKHCIEGSERDGLTKLLTYIAEHYGEPYSKYGSDNVRISWDRKGSKLE
jgi:hypothetical protein